jgi:hypothetical protein
MGFRLWLVLLRLRRVHGIRRSFRGLERRHGEQPRDARCHLHHPAEDAQSPAHGVENGIPELGSPRLGLAFRHRPTHRLILPRSGA